MTFQQLGLIAPILNALRDQGYAAPSPIQEKAIPPALRGRDVLGCAQTGTGKTCAFAAPILQRLHKNPWREKGKRPIRSLILTPTRELAIQIGESFQSYGKNLPLRWAVIFGGVGQQPQVDALNKGVDILVATPGRLQDLHDQGFVQVDRLEIFVLDEADRMLDMGFIHDVKKILTWLPQKKQTLFFSATMPPEVQGLVDSLLTDPVKVAVDPVSSPVEIIDQRLYYVDRGNKAKLLASLLGEKQVKNALIFTRTKHGANKVAGELMKAGIPAAAIHGNKSQTARVQALTDFKAGRIKALVATDIAARGLDIEELSHVFNYNLPDVPETYIHRIGRTGRAGRGGTAISFCEFGEKELLAPIEKLLKKPIPVVEDHPWPMVDLQAPQKDKHGKTVNPDDAEARQAARERKKLREEGKKKVQEAPVQPIKPPVQPIKPPAQPAKSPAQPAKSPAQPTKSPAQPTRPPAQTAAAGKRVSAGYKPSRTIDEALNAMAPKNPGKAPKKDTSSRDAAFEAWLAEERAIQEKLFRSHPLSGETVMDATARLLAPKGSVFPQEEPEEDRPQSRKKRRSRGKKPRQEAVVQAPAPPLKVPQKEKAKPAPQPPKAPAQPPKERQERSRRRTPMPRSRQRDSTEQSGSLMRPYYFSPDHED